MFDFCVVGHVTRDIVYSGGRRHEMPGGSALYTSLALRYLGASVAVVTCLGRDDEHLLQPLRAAGVVVRATPASATTTFENRYDASYHTRQQRVLAVADAIPRDNLAGLEAAAFHLGTLTEGDIGPDVLPWLASRGAALSLDAQGLLRRVRNDGRVVLQDWPGKLTGLRGITVLKANEAEARILSGESEPERMAPRLADMGPAEVVVTLGAQGAIVYASGVLHQVPAVPVPHPADPTGCGDTYIAGYLFARRQLQQGPAAAAEFAARLAAQKLRKRGPLLPQK